MEHKTKSRTFRRVKKKLPGNRTTTHYEKRKHSKAVCANCGAKLHGTATGSKNEMKKLTKSQRRPERPYGGVLCSKCTREKIKAEALK